HPERFGGATSTTLAPDGKTLVMARTASAFDTAHDRLDLIAVGGGPRWQTPVQPAPVPHLAYSPDGRTLFSSPANSTGAALWDVATGTQVRSLLRRQQGTPLVGAVFRPPGRELILTGDDGRVRLWDVSSDQEVEPERPLLHPAAVTALAVDAAGKRLLSGCRD